MQRRESPDRPWKRWIARQGLLERLSEQELLASKNFGETSLVEIRDMLASKGLSLGQYAQSKVEPEPLFEPELMSPDEQALLDALIKLQDKVAREGTFS